MTLVREDFPHAIREIEHEWIPLADGTRLAARIWLPEGALEAPVPALLEYLPYRKSDGTALLDSERHPYFAGHGYASVRVDLRGSGDSEGLLLGEYLLQEQDDGLEVIAWLASQPWCSGEVGMFGYSWGGFNSLQLAARRPPALKAIIPGCFAVDRFGGDCHYEGGCLLGSDMVKWASSMLAISALPPDPLVVGESWKERWLRRLEHTPAFAEDWISHQRLDDFWKHGSVELDWSAIEVPVLAWSGWADAYSDGVLLALEHLPGVRRGIIGPWGHMYPDRGVPGPAIGFLQECVRWWDRWLKGIENGVEHEPMLRVWIEEPTAPSGFVAEQPGRWDAEGSWPASSVKAQALMLRVPGKPDATIEIEGVQSCGEAAGVWCANGLPDELPIDQAADDARSFVFDFPPLEAPLEVLGFPRVRLQLAVDRPLALVAARLVDVWPDGTSSLVSWGELNLTHRASSEHPTELVPGRPFTVAMRLHAVGHTFPVGHRLRLALSPTYWPHAWPSPRPATLSVVVNGPSALLLPVREKDPRSAPPPEFAPPEVSASLAGPIEAASARTRRRDLSPGGTRHEILDREEHTTRISGTGTTVRVVAEERYAIEDGQPLSAGTVSVREHSLDRDGWSWRVRTESELTSDEFAFHLTNTVEAWDAGVVTFSRTRRRDIPRRLV